MDLELNLLYSPWQQLVVASVIMIAITGFTRLSQKVVITSLLYISYCWIPLNMFIAWSVEAYGIFLLHWTIVFIVFFILAILLSLICEKAGKPYTGDGALAMLIPLYLFPVSIVVSLIVKGGLALVTWISNYSN